MTMAFLQRQTNWGGLTALAMFLEGTCGAVIVVSLVLGSSLGVLVGAIVGMLAGLALLIEAGNPKNAYRLLTGLGHAWISRGTLLITLCIVFGLAYALPALSLFAWLPWNPDTILGKALGILAAISGFLLMLYPGFLLASFKPIPFWHTGLSPVISFSISALGGIGVAFLLVLFFPVGTAGNTLRTLGIAGISMLILQVVILWAYLDTAQRGGTTETESARLLMKMPAFTVGSIGVGVVVPLILLLFGATAADPPSLIVLYAIAGILLLVGVLATRYAILAAGVRMRWQPAA